jgi:quercetin 2,3-dioxygenase
MHQLIPSTSRGFSDHGWLKSHHTFSFSEYHNPDMMGFSSLRVINQDTIAPGTGFSTHGHRDMEIISYVIEGALEHKDSMGNATIIKPGEVQRMTAGTGIRHSEYNHLMDRPTHFLQIWILPRNTQLPPSYAQKDFSSELSDNGLCLVCSPNGESNSIIVHQDVKIYGKKSKVAESLSLSLNTNKNYWLQNIGDSLTVNFGINVIKMNSGDALAFNKEEVLKIDTLATSHFLLFELI